MPSGVRARRADSCVVWEYPMPSHAGVTSRMVDVSAIPVRTSGIR